MMRSATAITWSVAASLFFVLPSAGWGQQCPPQPDFVIETLSAKCKAEETTAEVRTKGNTIIITEPLVTPNPCYILKGNVAINGREIVVKLETETRSGMCIQYIGEIVGRVIIPELPKRTFSVKVETPQRTYVTTVEIK